MRSRLLTILLLIYITGCKSNHAIPDGVLPQKKMEMVLWDLMRADQFLADYVLNRDTNLDKTTESLKYYQKIFAIHKISKEQFQQSFSFYRSQPVLLKAIMDSISTPPIEAPVLPVQPEQFGDPIMAQPDTGSNKQVKIPFDTTLKKTKKLLPAQ